MPLDWAVVGTILLFIGLSMGTRLLLKEALSWAGSVKLVLCGLLWFLVTRWLPSAPDVGKRLLMGIPCVFAVICLAGGARAGTAFFHYRAGLKAQGERNVEEALGQYDKAVEMGQKLGIDALVNAALFQKAEVFYRQGDLAKAARALAMEEGFVRTIPDDAWDGPAGGRLYTNISCWKDLNLFEGQAEVQVFAWGQPAIGVWPRMVVRLGGKKLGEVEVASTEAKVYVFSADVKRGLQRLQISFINDYFQPPENRDLWVGRAEIHYQKINWR